MTERFPKMRIIFCIIFSLFYGASSKTINVATNGKVTLQSHVEGEIENIVWMHDGDKMVDWDNKAVNIREYLKFKGRIKLDVKTGDVIFIHLTKDDSGFYDAVVVIQGRIMNIKHRVEVTDPVTTAKVTCLSNATLHCEAEGDSLDYSWFGPGLKTAEREGQTGPQISKENQDSVYTCVVNNPVSYSSVTYHASDCFASGDHQHEGSSGDHQGRGSSGDLQLILGVVCAVAVIVIGVAAGLGYYCYKINSRGQKHTGNENKYETTGKIITNQKTEETVLLLSGKHQASSCAVSQNTCDQSLNSVDGDPRDSVQGRVKQLEKMALMIPTTCYVPMYGPGPFKESDSAPKPDESADPDHHADPSSGYHRQFGDADHTFSDDSKSSLFHMRNVEGTCENERVTNTGTVKQNQSTINKPPSGSAGNVSTDATVHQAQAPLTAQPALTTQSALTPRLFLTSPPQPLFKTTAACPYATAGPDTAGGPDPDAATGPNAAAALTMQSDRTQRLKYLLLKIAAAGPVNSRSVSCGRH